MLFWVLFRFDLFFVFVFFFKVILVPFLKTFFGVRSTGFAVTMWGAWQSSRLDISHSSHCSADSCFLNKIKFQRNN